MEYNYETVRKMYNEYRHGASFADLSWKYKIPIKQVKSWINEEIRWASHETKANKELRQTVYKLVPEISLHNATFIYLALRRNQVNTLYQLKKRSYKDILTMKGLGHRCAVTLSAHDLLKD